MPSVCWAHQPRSPVSNLDHQLGRLPAGLSLSPWRLERLQLRMRVRWPKHRALHRGSASAPTKPPESRSLSDIDRSTATNDPRPSASFSPRKIFNVFQRIHLRLFRACGAHLAAPPAPRQEGNAGQAPRVWILCGIPWRRVDGFEC